LAFKFTYVKQILSVILSFFIWCHVEWVIGTSV
jgi:hypothetical protein